MWDKEHGSNFSAVLDYKGERTILVHHEPRDYNLPNFAPAKWIYYSSVAPQHEKLHMQIPEYVKKYGVIIIIAILLALFAFSIVDVIEEKPKYEDFCGSNEMLPRRVAADINNCPSFKEPTKDEITICNEKKGGITYNYDANGCPIGYECDTCMVGFNDASKQHRLLGFIVTSVFGVIAILIGLYSKSKEDVVEWIFSGVLIGGILSVIFGTISYFMDMGRFVKPIVLIVELGLIILIALKVTKNKK